jgi:hypothetical protein
MAAGIFTVLYLGIWSQYALADEPPAPSPPPAIAAATAEQGTAPANGEKSAAAGTAGQNAVPAAPGSIKPGITVTSAKPELTTQEKEMISRGYKLEMRHGEKYFCRKEAPIGSRFEIKTCDTSQSIQAHQDSGQQALREMQNDRPQISK